MYDDGYKNIVNLDVVSVHSLSLHDAEPSIFQYSPVVIERMRKQHQDPRPEMRCGLASYHMMADADMDCLQGLKWMCVDSSLRMAHLTLPSTRVRSVLLSIFICLPFIGTMDAMMTSKGDVWDPLEQVMSDCNTEVTEVLRVLRPSSGTFLYLTFGQPHFRRRYLTRPNTHLAVRELGNMFHYYLYVVKKA